MLIVLVRPIVVSTNRNQVAKTCVAKQEKQGCFQLDCTKDVAKDRMDLEGPSLYFSRSSLCTAAPTALMCPRKIRFPRSKRFFVTKRRPLSGASAISGKVSTLRETRAGDTTYTLGCRDTRCGSSRTAQVPSGSSPCDGSSLLP